MKKIRKNADKPIHTFMDYPEEKTNFHQEIRYLLQSTCKDIEARTSSIWLLQGDEVICLYSLNKELEGFTILPQVGIVGEVMKSGNPYLTQSCNQDPIMIHRVIDYFGFAIRNVATVPIGNRQSMGAVQFFDKLNNRDFTQEDIQKIHQMSIRLENWFNHPIGIKQIQRHCLELKKKWEIVDRFPNVIGRSSSMQRVLQQAWLAACNDFPVILQGETGTGKEVLARAIHYLSQRKNDPFVEINCGALSNELAESELFGHIRGAFTGALRDREGLIEAANGGVLFLDEIADIPSAEQIRLLRFLQEGKIRRVGDNKERAVTTRLIAATNRDLHTLIDKELFRQDFYFRVCVFQIEIPPLRRRGNDIKLLTQYFVRREDEKRSVSKPMRIAPSTYELLLKYSFPGNVRELQNAIQVAYAVAESEGILRRKHFALTTIVLQTDSSTSSLPLSDTLDVLLPLKELERNHIELVLKHTQGKKGEAARILGIHPNVLTRKLKKYGLS